jgi:negative regulator of flagellin synthesis FlgM
VKINSAIPSVGTAPDSGRPRTESRVAPRSSTESDTQVDVSSLASRLQELGGTLSSSPVVDSKRVAEIKQAIAEGRFKIDPERIADGLLDSVRQLLKKQ